MTSMWSRCWDRMGGAGYPVRMSEPSRRPTRKVTGAGLGGAIAVVWVWLIELSGTSVPPEVAAALATIAAFGGGYLTDERAIDVGVPPSGAGAGDQG